MKNFYVVLKNLPEALPCECGCESNDAVIAVDVSKLKSVRRKAIKADKTLKSYSTMEFYEKIKKLDDTLTYDGTLIGIIISATTHYTSDGFHDVHNFMLTQACYDLMEEYRFNELNYDLVGEVYELRIINDYLAEGEVA